MLWAEDNKVNQSLASALLRPAGHTVTIVSNGIEAVDAATAQRFDAIFMDVQMPEMNGFGATAVIRAREASTGARTRIVAMTAHAMQGDRERCLEAGMDDCVAKPISAHDLRRALSVLEPAGTVGVHGIAS